MTVFVTIRNQFREFQSFSGAAILWLVCSAVCDVLIAIALIYSLVCVTIIIPQLLWLISQLAQSTRKTGSSAVDGQINRIIRRQHLIL